MRSSGTDITLDDVLTMLDEHYNNVKALDALSKELFQLCMGEKETVSDWGVCLSRHLQILTASFLECFPPDCVAKLKHDHFCSGVPKQIKAMVAYLKASANEKTYSNYLQAAREARKEEAIEPFHSQSADKPSKLKVMSFFPLRKLTGTKPTKTPAVRAVQLEEDGSSEEADAISEDPDRINGMMEEFIVHLARAVKEAQQDEKCCYHCSSMEHFIHKCSLVKASRSAMHLSQKEGMAPEKGAWTSPVKVAKPKVPQEGMPKA